MAKPYTGNKKTQQIYNEAKGLKTKAEGDMSKAKKDAWKDKPLKTTAQRIAESVQPLIDLLETGKPLPWQKPWKDIAQNGIPYNPKTGTRYSGANPIFLMNDMETKGYTDVRYITFEAGKKDGFYPPAGTGVTIFAFERRPVDKKDDAGNVIIDPETGEPEKIEIPFPIAHTVFNVEVMQNKEGKTWAETYPEPKVALKPVFERREEFDEIFRKTGADIRYGGNSAFYSPGKDYIQMPNPEQFKSLEQFYGTQAHELVHWTGAPDRLNRDKKYHEKEGRAFEELVAELGAFMMCATIGIPNLKPDNHAAYVQGWARILKEDPKALLKAGMQASKSVSFILHTEKYQEEVKVRQEFNNTASLEQKQENKRNYRQNIGNNQSANASTGRKFERNNDISGPKF